MLKSTDDEKNTAIGKYNYKKKNIEELHYYSKSVWGIKALNLEQKFVFDALLDPAINLVTLVGQAGTGKTLLALAAGLKQTLDDNLYKKLLVSRPIVPLGKDIGFLPGSKDEKLSVWMQPIFDNLYFILNQTGEAVSMDKDIPKNILFTWSLNPQIIIDNEEHITASLVERLNSAKQIADLGYLVGFHLHPMIDIKDFNKGSDHNLYFVWYFRG